MLGLARKQTLGASGGSVSLSSYAQTQRSCARASTRVAAAARSGLIDLHLHCVVDLADGWHQPCMCLVLRGSCHRVHVRCCEEADLASLGWICDAEQLYTDEALVLDASKRV